MNEPIIDYTPSQMLREFAEMTRLAPEEVLRMVVDAEKRMKPPTRIQTAFGVVEIVESKFMPPNKIAILQDKPASAMTCNV